MPLTCIVLGPNSEFIVSLLLLVRAQMVSSLIHYYHDLSNISMHPSLYCIYLTYFSNFHIGQEIDACTSLSCCALMCLCTYVHTCICSLYLLCTYILLFRSSSWLSVRYSITYSLCRNMKMALVLCATIIFSLLPLLASQREFSRILHI